MTAEQAHAAQQLPVVVAPDRGMPAAAPYVVDLVRRELERDGVSLATGGLRITTTIDAALQRAANDALRAGTLRVESRPGIPAPDARAPRAGEDGLPAGDDRRARAGDAATCSRSSAAATTRSPPSIARRSRCGSRGRRSSRSCTPTAMLQGAQANELVADSAISIAMPKGPPYAPDNSDGEFLGPLTLREALVRSRNTVAVQLGPAGRAWIR